MSDRNSETIQHEDGRVELREEALPESGRSLLYNEDLAPVPVGRRDWTSRTRPSRLA